MRLHCLIAALAFTGVWAQNSQFPIISRPSPLDSPPLLGFGTWNLKVKPENTTDSVSLAIETGYRHIDCAAAYGNEKDVGRGIKEGIAKVTGLQRENLWITSKLWNNHHGNIKTVEEGLNRTLLDLGLDYLDLYLMHWPVGNAKSSSSVDYDYVQTWKSMEKLLSTGRVRHIGVCNFSPHQLKKLIKKSNVKPYMHQMELHPYLQQQSWVDWHLKHGIKVTAYSPLGNMNPTYRHDSAPKARTPRKIKKGGPPLLLKNEILEEIAAKYEGVTTAQVALAWGIGRETSVIPKSSHEKYIVENFGSLGVDLDEEDESKLTGLGKKYLTRFNNPSDGWGVDLFEGLDDA